MMLVLDTNVISELMKAQPDPRIVAWLDSQPSDSIWTTSFNVFEVSFGLHSLPEGRRKRKLQDSFEVMLVEEFNHRVLDFNSAAADQAGQISAKLRQAGRPVEIRDVQIAGIVSNHQAILVTRNQKHFNEIAISLVNPWGD